jgi:hypothetical protein
MSVYSLDDYNNLKFNSAYTLPSVINDIIAKLASQLSVSIEPVTNLVYKKKHNFKEIKDEDWKVKPFKTTIIINNKSGHEKMIDDIRVCMNKISKTNYGEQLNTIIKYIKPILSVSSENEDNSVNKDNMYKIAQTIFDISSTNKFFSELYADLYRDLIEQFPIFNELLDTMILNFTKTMENIEYVSPDTDYDKHCSYNNENDRRKATSNFLVNLMKRDVISADILICRIIEIMNIMKGYMEMGNHMNEIDEIVENLFILITLGKDKYSFIADWDNVVIFIKNISELKLKQSNISNRCIFKCIDIYQNILGIRK